METKTALVWSDCRVELHAVTSVCLDLTIVIDPGNLECKDALRFNDALHNLCILKFRMLVIYIFNRLQNFMHSLKVLLLVRVLGLELGHQIISVHYYVY